MADTIYSLATAQGRAGVAVIRVSGPDAYLTCCQLANAELPVSGRSLRPVMDAEGILIDEVLFLSFAKGASFTGEAVIELHCHGSIAVVQALLSTLATFPNLRQSEAGEFTKRAFENGRLDLTQVEGLGDLIEAETEAQRIQAARVMQGGLSKRVALWRQDLLRAAALCAAEIDFSDEDIPEEFGQEITDCITRAKVAIEQELRGAQASERIRAGFEVAIIGKPNIGKSTLLNALAGREAAIISEHAGTTRDVIEVRMNITGLAVTVLDTAGIREAQDAVEKIGVARGQERARLADMRVFLVDEDGVDPLGLTPGSDDIILSGKADLLDDPDEGVSGATGHGVDRLLGMLSERLSARVEGASLAVNQRHQQALTGAQEALSEALARQSDQLGSELVADAIREALEQLSVLIGTIGVEDVLGEIFSSFCIGK